MGQDIGNLFSQGGLTNPGTGLLDSSGNTAAVGTPKQMQTGFYKSGIADMQQQHPFAPGTPNPNAPTNPLHIGTPSFVSAATSGATPGGANALSPGLNKAGKLVTLLTSGLQGAMAGRAANEQAVVQSGGRRSGGAGMGFEAGYTLPAQRAEQQNQIAQQQAQTQLTRSQSDMIPTPYGPMPSALARYILPAQIRGQAEQGAAQTRAGATESAANTAAQAGIQKEQIGQRFKTTPNGLYDTQTNSLIPQTAGGITITPAIAKDYNIPAEYVGKPMKLTDLSSFQRSTMFQNTPEMTAEGPIMVNRRTSQATPVTGPGGKTYGPPSLASPIAVGDPNNPGQTLMVPRGQAAGMAGPQSASVQVPRQEMKSEVPTNIGNKNVAFTTMIQHAELLRSAAQALHNGNVQALSGLENAFKNEFGYSGPITARAIADAYGGEVTDVVSKGHITDKEIEKTGRTIDPEHQNFDTINSVLNAYQALAQSKMKNLGNQADKAVNKSQAGVKGATPQKQNDPLGIRQ